jgi:hypothetical protein
MSATSPIPNRISLDIPAETLQTIHGALQTLTDQLNPHLVLLSGEDIRMLCKMGPRTSDFVARAFSYMQAMPQYCPGFVDVVEFRKDLDAVDTLRELQHQLGATHDMVDATAKLAGSEAYAASLSIYEALKTAAKRGSVEAKKAVDDLASRLGTRGPGKTGGKTPGEPAPGTGPTPAA